VRLPPRSRCGQRSDWLTAMKPGVHLATTMKNADVAVA
jgi:hypothetical protein